MKKFIALFLAAVILLPILASCGRKKLDEPIEFIIANDIHYISPSLLGDENSDLDGVQYSRDGKIVHYISEITDAFINEVIEKKPKALILAGDLTLNGARLSHEELVGKLKSVKDAGIDVLIIPGNHDVDKTAVDYSGEKPQEAEALDSNGFIELYAQLMPDGIDCDPSSQSFIYKAAEKLWILMLDTNIYGQCYAKDLTLDWVEEKLKAAQADKIDVITVSHQNIYAHSELLSFGYQLYNADKLISLYEKYGILCNLSGHIHLQSIVDNKSVPEIATSSLAITGTHYGMISYDGRELAYRAESLNVSAYANKMGFDNADLLDFSKYATSFFEEIASKQAAESLAGSGISEENIAIMAETYAKINSAYFEGKPIDKSEYSAGLEQWELYIEESFIAKYIMSMLKNPDGGGLEITIKID